MPFATGINGAIILSPHNGYQPWIGSVGLADGLIAYVGDKPIGPGEAARRIDATGHILMPGLFNGHCHGDMTFARGLGDDLTLLEQNERFADTNWFYSLIDDDVRYASRMLTYCESLLAGTTFINENMYWTLGERSISAMVTTGIRGALTEDVRYNFANSGHLVEDATLQELAKKMRAQGIVPLIGGIAEENYTAELLKDIEAKRRRLDLLQTSHLAETAWRQAIIKEKYGRSPIQILSDCDCLSSQLIGSHVVWADHSDIALLAANQVKVVNMPQCEMKIADGIAPIPAMLQAGICVSLGTDGGMWNNSNDIFREMKGMMLLHTINSGIRSLKTTDVLDMATINGARTFGLAENLGSIEPGKWADLILIDARQAHLTPLRLGACENVASTVVFSATGRDVTDVFVGGRQVVEKRNLMTVDLAKIRERVSADSNRLALALG
jgi:5-methylthioadenosine/S-adenosylhomocysteine deaminase